MSLDEDFAPIPLSSAERVAAYSLQEPDSPTIELGQARHRIRIINTWGIRRGSRILEIGCGQGNCTAVLAEAVGPSGHVDAVDPAPGDYGAPFTLDQAQAFLSNGPVGQRISWHRADPVEFLAQGNETWDAVVFLHCIWYFASPETLKDILVSLKGRVRAVYVAEYALHASKATAAPHVLAAIARGAMEVHKVESNENIRTLVSPHEIREIAEAVGWSLEEESRVVPEDGLFDGMWEASAVAGKGFLHEVQSEIEDSRVATLVRSGRDAVISSAGAVGGLKRVTTMDVWIGAFTVKAENH